VAASTSRRPPIAPAAVRAPRPRAHAARPIRYVRVMGSFPGRHSARIEGDFVVFLIGMRINKPWKPHRWLPVFLAMPKMIKELERDPDSGFLGSTQGLWTTGPSLVQYWRSFEDLERYARDPDQRHLPAWRAFNQRVRASDDVGIWHETYRVRAGEYEAIYGNMPRVGLAKVGDHVALGSTTSAARRIGDRPADEPPIAGY
jgi:hypothetical protein